MAQIKLNIIQIVHTPHYEKLLIQIVHMDLGKWHDPNKRHVPSSSHVASIQHWRVIVKLMDRTTLPDCIEMWKKNVANAYPVAAKFDQKWMVILDRRASDLVKLVLCSLPPPGSVGPGSKAKSGRPKTYFRSSPWTQPCLWNEGQYLRWTEW